MAAFTLILPIVATGICRGDPVRSSSEIKRIRFWTAPDHTRVVLDMGGESVYRMKVLTNPHRIVIEVPSGRIAKKVGGMAIGDGVIDRIRINKLRSCAQVVLDLPSKAEFRHFALKPFKGHPHRIVVDVNHRLSAGERERERELTESIVRSGDRVVIIDPGHGGSQPGACSPFGPREKDIVLTLSKLIAAQLEKKDGIRAVLTRDGDYDVGLQRRIDIAKQHEGDCFLSIHMNSHPSSKPRGSEIYFLSLDKASDKNAQIVAERENMYLKMGESGREINDDIKSILFDFNQKATMYRSSVLANRIASNLQREGILPFRGVKQANFVVLRSIAMPSALLEVGFLSNRKDVRLMARNKVLQECADCIAAGVVDFMEEYPPEEKGERIEAIVHVVASGETLWGIARRYGVTTERICNINGLKSKEKIRPGQKLRILH